MRTLIFRVFVATAAAGWLLLGGTSASAQPAPATGCETCHRNEQAPGLAAPARDFTLSDVHRDRGFTCVDCHGGNGATTDKAAAKAPATGFRGKPSGQQVLAVCSRCHSDAALMRKYAPRQRVDQEAEYATSVHGQQLAKGDTKVATCVSCHGAHGVRLVADAQSPVYPLNVAATCTTCHANAGYMQGYTLNGGPLPIDQGASYAKSVHHAALVDRSDMSAPTCNDCHGNHGAAPPGVGAITNVCGTCHTMFATKFALSTHSLIFERGCVECHSNHDIVQPTDAMLGTDQNALCSTCHGDGDNGFKAATAMHAGIEGLRGAIAEAQSRVVSVENEGFEMGDQLLKLREAANHLTLSRTEMHAFDPATVQTILDEGMGLTASVDQAAESAEQELSFRKTGLAISLAAILLVVVALQLKIRSLHPPA
ncbi:MAG: cytochrome c3 family protein [Acidobacteria bacterium]|nr:cytochrome c3 family protein [Acidobacteriota bacterium]